MTERNDPKVIKTIIKGLESRDEGERNSVAWKLRNAADGDDELAPTGSPCGRAHSARGGG
ncbi:unnamed protein product [Symbiodinium pilosum]|uniref:Uncharacterized protein n=1 Tax=Symbiodinium pilosum TaxID=2952 RepID=A0A812LTG0_SYMPI|nr:unnamed protein product [Symbiodinium pilosum]